MLALGGIHKEMRKMGDHLSPAGGENRLIVYLEQGDSLHKITLENPTPESIKSVEAWLNKKLQK